MLRSAWMPPAVAQAPIVTSFFETRRTSLDPLDVVLRRHRPLDERQVVRPLGGRAPRLDEVGDLDLARELQQLVLAVEQGELAAVAGGELPYREARLAGRAHSSLTASSGSSSLQR